MSEFNDNGIPGDNVTENSTEKTVTDEIVDTENNIDILVEENSDTKELNLNGKYEPAETAANAEKNFDQLPRMQYPYNNSPYGGNGYDPNRIVPNNDPYNNFNRNNIPNGNNPPVQTSYLYNRPYNNVNRDPYSYSNNRFDNGYAYAKKDEPNDNKQKNGSKTFVIVTCVILAFIVIGFVAGYFGLGKILKTLGQGEEVGTEVPNVEEFTSSATPDAEISANTSENGVLTPKAIFEKVKESSVGILVYDSSKSLASEGTGVIMTEDKDGKYTYIITCAHVISDKNVSIMVQLFSGKEYTAQVVGYDVKTDIGVLRIEVGGLKAAEYGDSSKLYVGDTVYAIGNPGGTEFANSFTNGMISAIDRPVSSSSTGYTMECIQHTAAINPGNSGGALVNEFGQVIGINSMKIIADEYEGMGFAVPSSVFIGIVNEIIENGYVSNRPKLGITYVSASEQQSYAMYVAIKGLPSGSIIVYSISEDSDLVNSDVQKGDLITSVNGKALDNASDLSEVIEQSKVGDTIKLHIVRINSDYSAKEFDVDVKLVEDRGDTLPEEETTESFYDRNNNNGGYGGYDSDFYDEFFRQFFGGYGQP